MHHNARKIAIIPARGGSKRIPRKNIYPIGGMPMLAHTIGAALKADIFSQVIVSSDDEEILDIAKTCGAEGIKRPAHLATDEAFEIDVYKHVIEGLKTKPDFFCGIYPTAIFIEPDDIQNSFNLLNEVPAADVVMGVSTYPIHPYKALKTNDLGFLEMMYPVECLQRSQTYPALSASNGTFYWFRTNAFLQNTTYYVERLKGYDLPADRAIDIDTPEDLHMAEIRYRLKAAK